MARKESAAFVKLQQIVETGRKVTIDKTLFGWEITVWARRGYGYEVGQHSHYKGETLAEAIYKVTE